MRNYWLIAKYEYRRMVFSRGFILATILIPVGMAALIFIAYLVETMGQDDKPIGYVDKLGIFDESLQDALPDPDGRVEIREFVDEAETGRTALRPAFREMISVARSPNKPFDAILVWKYSRFARSRHDSIFYKAMLKKAEVNRGYNRFLLFDNLLMFRLLKLSYGH